MSVELTQRSATSLPAGSEWWCRGRTSTGTGGDQGECQESFPRVQPDVSWHRNC